MENMNSKNDCFGTFEFHYQYLNYQSPPPPGNSLGRFFPSLNLYYILYYILANCFAFQKNAFSVLFQKLESNKENAFFLLLLEKRDSDRSQRWQTCRKSSNPFVDSIGSIWEKAIRNAQPWEKLNLSSHLVKHKRINPQDKKPQKTRLQQLCCS